MSSRLRYVSGDEDSARWDGFMFRDGDIVISTRSKSGTTWMQMICALLVLGTPRLPAPLAVLSPWLDHTVEPVADVRARLEAQRHRRFVKTHTPLDGLPLDPRATYVVVARHPLDLAAEAASFDRMRSRSAELVPDAHGVLAEPARFFRSGRSGAGREVLTTEELARYEARVASLASPEVVAWLHR